LDYNFPSPKPCGGGGGANKNKNKNPIFWGYNDVMHDANFQAREINLSKSWQCRLLNLMESI
jgi:hypothetical protein